MHVRRQTQSPFKKKTTQPTSKISRTGSLTSRGSDESKSRRVFGSLLRRHTSFGAPDSTRSVAGSTQSVAISAAASPQDNTDG